MFFFNQMSWIAANEPVSVFDYNRNGRIDFADVVALFNRLWADPPLSPFLSAGRRRHQSVRGA